MQAGAPLDPQDKKRSTPLHLAAERGHNDVARLLVERGASLSCTDSNGLNPLSLAIASGHHAVARVILNSEDWRTALHNHFLSGGTRETPVRLLIKRFPDLAELVFDKCSSNNLEESNARHHDGKTVDPSHPQLLVTMDYEFIDDTYCDPSEEDETGGGGVDRVWDEAGRLGQHARPYSRSVGEIRANHPLSIMAATGREELLLHPLCQALLRRKWNTFGRWAFYTNLLYYLAFVAALTAYLLLCPRTHSRAHLAGLAGAGPDKWRDCQWVRTTFNLDSAAIPWLVPTQQTVAAIAATRIIFELFQILQAQF